MQAKVLAQAEPSEDTVDNGRRMPAVPPQGVFEHNLPPQHWGRLHFQAGKRYRESPANVGQTKG